VKRPISFVALLAFAANLGCSSVRKIPPSKIEDKDERVVAAAYHDGRKVEFQKIPDADASSPRMRENKGRAFRYGILVPETRTIDGVVGTRSVSIPTDSLATVSVKRTDAAKTTLAVIGITAGSFLAILLIAIATDPMTGF
jgi:hypothetical protein